MNISHFYNRSNLLLHLPKGKYRNLIKSSRINDIINNMPNNLSLIEKAYYLYLELGKIISENPRFVFSDWDYKNIHYNDNMDNRYYGICKSISELYVSILRDKRIGIYADLVKKYPNISMTHIDVILKIDGKNYIVNLISDLSRIKTSRRVNSFCFDLTMQGEKKYLERLEDYYGKIDSLQREDIEKLDKKLGYSFFIPRYTEENERGIYNDDTIELLRQDMNNPVLFKEYILNNEEVSDEELLKYKLDYIFENIDNLTSFNSDMSYLENIRYYFYIAKKILSKEEISRIQSYVAIIGDDFSNIISILKVKLHQEGSDKKSNIYYLYSTKYRKYISKTPEEMKKYLDSINKNSLQMIGKFDRFCRVDREELEI